MTRDATPEIPKRGERLLLHYPMSFPSDKQERRYQTFLRSYTFLLEWAGWIEAREFRVRKREQSKRFRALKRKARATINAINIIRDAIAKVDGDPLFDAKDSRARLFATGLTKHELEEGF